MQHLLRTAALACLLGLFSSCAGLMMTVEDVDGSNDSVRLVQGATVMVAAPIISAEAEERLANTKITSAQLSTMLQDQMIAALNARGVTAAAGGKADNSLQIEVLEFSAGSGAARMFLGGIAGDSDLNGSATLTSPQGTRKLSIEKTGSQSGTTEAGDQTRENVGYFTAALADYLLGED